MRVDDTPTLAEVLALYRPAWMADALCQEYERGAFFSSSPKVTGLAKQICSRCSVQTECLEYAMADAAIQGVWGGTSGRDRRRLQSQPAA